MSVSTIKLMENFADYCAVNNKVIRKNIANIGTEGYQREDVVFKDVLNENMTSMLKTTDPRQIGGTNVPDAPEYEIKVDKSNNNASGINNVDIDKEMSNLAENSLNFSFITQKMGDYFKNIQMVISGGQ